MPEDDLTLEVPEVPDVHELDKKFRKALLTCLDKERDRRGHQFGLSSQMGDSRSFVTSVTVGWAAENVFFATELPMFNEYRDEHDVVELRDADAATIDMIQQRSADWRRQLPMTLYLTTRVTHKFPPLILVVTQAWVDDDAADEWDHDKRALYDSINASTLDSSGYFVDLEFREGSMLYAIDGQHRLMALKGLKELLERGRLGAKKKNSEPKKGGYTIEEILKQSHGRVKRADLQNLLDERIGVEIIPAVMAGETRKEALRRLRSIFVYVNRTPKALSKGEIALLDDEDGFCVVARNASVTHALLKGRVHMTKGQLQDSSEELTTLETLGTMCKSYMKHKYQDWLPDTRIGFPMRPEEVSLDEGLVEFKSFFDEFRSLPSMKEVERGALCTEYRHGEEDAKGGNLLFRPLGQMALAGAIGDLVAEGEMTQSEAFEKLRDAETRGLLQMELPENPWYGVVWDPVKKKMQRKNASQVLCHRLLVHLIAGTTDTKEREDLRDDFALSRIDSEDETHGRNLKGDRVPLESIDLPVPW